VNSLQLAAASSREKAGQKKEDLIKSAGTKTAERMLRVATQTLKREKEDS
jgi:hypothetical protein